MQNKNLVHYYPELDSTSAEMRRLLCNNTLPHGFCIITDYQTDGHGQASNKWESENSQNLLFTILLHPTYIAPNQQFIITELVTKAITETIKEEINDEIDIKWPNDIYVGDKKLCGILIENSICGNQISDCLIGVGININQTNFVSDAPNPISLKQITGKTHNRKTIIERIYNRIIKEYETLTQTDNVEENKYLLHKYYMNHLYRRNGFHKYTDTNGYNFYGKIDNIDKQGFLYLTDKATGNTTQYAFKEVKFIID